MSSGERGVWWQSCLKESNLAGEKGKHHDPTVASLFFPWVAAVEGWLYSPFSLAHFPPDSHLDAGIRAQRLWGRVEWALLERMGLDLHPWPTDYENCPSVSAVFQCGDQKCNGFADFPEAQGWFHIEEHLEDPQVTPEPLSVTALTSTHGLSLSLNSMMTLGFLDIIHQCVPQCYGGCCKNKSLYRHF